jgi:membrane protease YdiL (CAAX protease family)
LWALRHGRFTAALAGVLAVLVTANLLRFLGPAGTGLVLGPTVAVGLVILARRSGLTWHDLGLARRTWLRGAVYAAAAVGTVLAVYAVGIAVPLTRSAFLDARYHLPVGAALITALVVIPVGTVLLEEVAFRGVLQALVTRHRGVRWGLGVSSAVFGVWHVLPSLGLNRTNQVLGHLLGSGAAAQVVAVTGVVAFTAVAGLLLSELRRRSGSLLAAAGLHWATNGLGVLAAALIYTASG